MVAIPPWLTKNSDAELQFSRREQSGSPEASGERLVKTKDDSKSDIPVFCEGGCGEVVGYLTREQTTSEPGRYARWCPTCKAAKDRVAEAPISFASADELVELHRPNRNLRWLSFLQVAILTVIIAGSALIAMGRVMGVYLAVFGTLAWCAVYFGVRKLRE